MKNNILLDRKAEIALDTLPIDERKQIEKMFDDLVFFPATPATSSVKIYEITKKFFMAADSLHSPYRVIFYHQDHTITIFDVIHHDIYQIQGVKSIVQ